MKKQLFALAMCTISLLTFQTSNAQNAPTHKSRQHGNVLNLTADQQAKIKELRKTEKEQERAILTPEQQAKQDSLFASHKQHFAKGRQGHRRGHAAFAKLNLSDQQKARLKTLHQTQKGKITAVKSNTNLSDQEKRQQITAIRKESRQEFQKLLTPEQKSQIQKMRSSRKNTSTQNNS